MWYDVSRDEQETIINVDYEERTLILYTNRKNVANKLIKKVGKPSRIEKIDEKISGIEYKVKLSDKNLKAFFSVGTIIGGFRQDK
jgi:hypothetical protein